MIKYEDKKITPSIGILDLLLVTFIVLKLTHVIDWSWWFVMAPLWAPIAVIVAIVIIVALLGLLDI